eukprot:Nk52_evm9s1444 gene=Nk52_evmTU9s1444
MKILRRFSKSFGKKSSSSRNSSAKGSAAISEEKEPENEKKTTHAGSQTDLQEKASTKANPFTNDSHALERKSSSGSNPFTDLINEENSKNNTNDNTNNEGYQDHVSVNIDTAKTNPAQISTGSSFPLVSRLSKELIEKHFSSSPTDEKGKQSITSSLKNNGNEERSEEAQVASADFVGSQQSIDNAAQAVDKAADTEQGPKMPARELSEELSCADNLSLISMISDAEESGEDLVPTVLGIIHGINGKNDKKSLEASSEKAGSKKEEFDLGWIKAPEPEKLSEDNWSDTSNGSHYQTELMKENLREMDAKQEEQKPFANTAEVWDYIAPSGVLSSEAEKEIEQKATELEMLASELRNNLSKATTIGPREEENTAEEVKPQMTDSQELELDLAHLNVSDVTKKRIRKKIKEEKQGGSLHSTKGKKKFYVRKERERHEDLEDHEMHGNLMVGESLAKDTYTHAHDIDNYKTLRESIHGSERPSTQPKHHYLNPTTSSTRRASCRTQPHEEKDSKPIWNPSTLITKQTFFPNETKTVFETDCIDVFDADLRKHQWQAPVATLKEYDKVKKYVQRKGNGKSYRYDDNLKAMELELETLTSELSILKRQKNEHRIASTFNAFTTTL